MPGVDLINEHHTVSFRAGQEKIRVRAKPAFASLAALYPSVGEYSIYTEDMYDGFYYSAARNREYRAAIKEVAGHRVALDIGTGRDALWALSCARAGSPHVYAVESIPKSAAMAEKAIQRAGMSSRISVIEGVSQQISLPKGADLCVFDIIGNIAGSEGVNAVIGDARDRLCSSSAKFIPWACSTAVGAVSFCRSQWQMPCVATESISHIQQVFDVVGHAFDLRLCIAGPASEFLISSICEVEQIQFEDMASSDSHAEENSLVITADGQLQGLMLWPRVYLSSSGRCYDALRTQEPSWGPVYIPVSLDGVSVNAGDSIDFEFGWQLSDDKIHPDYWIEGLIRRRGQAEIPIQWHSPHHAGQFRQSDTYRYLFPI